jgi:hypothetical protein
VNENLTAVFPRLAERPHEVTSQADSTYNCIAWAAGVQSAWWWPDGFGEYYWPHDVPRSETVAAFAAAFGTLGYSPCEDRSFEAGIEKIAIYVDAAGVPTHAARQLEDGTWTSKLGQLQDITHSTPDDLYCDVYGSICLFLQRPRLTV